VILDQEPQFVAESIKKFNRILRIKIKLSILFYPQVDGQMECMN